MQRGRNEIEPPENIEKQVTNVASAGENKTMASSGKSMDTQNTEGAKSSNVEVDEEDVP